MYACHIRGILTASPSHPHTDCACFSIGVGTAVGGFIGGVLLTAAIGIVITVAVVYRIKKELRAFKK